MRAGWRVGANLVAFAVLATALAYGMATEVLPGLTSRYSVYAIFRDAGGVFTDQEVTYRGVTVGQVGRMEVVPQGVKIELEIDDGVDIPARAVRARVMFKSAVGEQFVDLLPPAGGKPYLEDGDVIPLERTRIPISTQQLLGSLEAVLEGVPPEALQGAIDSLGEGLTGRGGDIGAILESTADLTELLAQRAPEVQSILERGTKVGGTFLRSKEDFVTAVHELVAVSRALSRSRQDLRRLLEGTNLLSDEAVAFLRANRRQLNRLLRELAKITELQARRLPELSGTLRHVPSALAAIAGSFEPETGMIRFGILRDELEEPFACSYGTPRRRPTDRSKRLPPKNARCREVRDDSSQVGGASNGASRQARDEAPALPTRMTDWSWTLFYLNGMNPSA